MTLVERFRQWLRGLLGIGVTTPKIQGLMSEAVQTIADVESHSLQMHEIFLKDGIKQIKVGEHYVPGHSFWVDEYLGPNGAGYVLHYEKEQDGKKLHRSIGVGPERSGDTGWVEVVPMPAMPRRP
jgi:hypothetical protein